MVAGIPMSIAEYERELVWERTALKLEHARKSGRKFGRPAKADDWLIPMRQCCAGRIIHRASV
ncbi:MAG: recombinase family protein [Mycobacterium sp.]|nr:recombinase family protein [Mycobacterium sp.]